MLSLLEINKERVLIIKLFTVSVQGKTQIDALIKPDLQVISNG